MSFHYIGVTIQEQGLKTKTVCFLLGFPICSPSLAQTPRILMPSLIKMFLAEQKTIFLPSNLYIYSL